MALFGVFATHSPESCPLNNMQSKDTMIMIDNKIKSITEKFHVRQIHGFYLSVLEHEWVIIVEADSPHEIEAMCIEAGISAFNTVKIVPLSNFDVVMQKIKGSQATA
ncbi:MAG TPA: hypothetical protein VD736_06345 [Nitrososphaera sp.]|nr:hypothetical protein [Nitrososphaera sp.]